jgi:hypothetical protein
VLRIAKCSSGVAGNNNNHERHFQPQVLRPKIRQRSADFCASVSLRWLVSGDRSTREFMSTRGFLERCTLES